MMNNSKRTDCIQQIRDRRLSAIIRTKNAQLAADAMNAAVAGGFRMVEFTLTTPNAFELIAQFAGNAELLVGAGTVMNVEQAKAAGQAGARFIVSPICDPEVITAARAADLVTIPGTFTATEMQAAHQHGADFVKLFPAPADVADYVRAILGPLPELRIYPTAGVDAENFIDVLAAGAAGVGFVRSLFDPTDLANKNFSAIEKRAADIHQRFQDYKQHQR